MMIILMMMMMMIIIIIIIIIIILFFDVHVTIHRDNFFIIKPTRCNNFSNFSNFHSHPARKLSANLYDLYHCCVYSEKLLMMDTGTLRNM